jgi:hypothetical protein
MGIRSVCLYDGVEAGLWIGSVVNFSNGTVRLNDTIVAFYDTVVPRLPLAFDVATVQVLDSVAERVGRMCLKSVENRLESDQDLNFIICVR